MKCSQCQFLDSKVIESRDVADGQAIRRRRECIGCQHRFTTYERVERPNLVGIKSDGTRPLFSREKMLAGLQRACDKTIVTNMQLEAFVADIERDLYAKGDPEVTTSDIGEMIMDRLAALDQVAYERFASVYRRFKDIASFEQELSRIRHQQVKE